jgi:hypothetical protein
MFGGAPTHLQKVVVGTVALKTMGIKQYKCKNHIRKIIVFILNLGNDHKRDNLWKSDVCGNIIIRFHCINHAGPCANWKTGELVLTTNSFAKFKVYENKVRSTFSK